MQTAKVMELYELSKSFASGQENLQVLKKTDFVVYKNEFVMIMGASGSGKSTLINILGFMDTDYQGNYYFEGDKVNGLTDDDYASLRNQKIGFIFQDFHLIRTLTIRDNLAIPLRYNKKVSRKEGEQRIKANLEYVGILDKIDRLPHELSGGQRQRVAIARALMGNPSYIVADEPTGALDQENTKIIMEILKKLQGDSQVTIIMVTHDASLLPYADRHYHIEDGEIEEILGDAYDT